MESGSNMSSGQQQQPTSRVIKTEPSSASQHPPQSSSSSAGSSSTTTLLRGRALPSNGPVKKQQQRRTPSPSPPPPTTYRDIPLLSLASDTPWVHHLARFVHHARMDPTDQAAFVPPLKLNRKQPPRVKQPAPKPGDPVVDRNGRPVKLPSGQILTWPKVGDDVTEHLRLMERMKPQEK